VSKGVTRRDVLEVIAEFETLEPAGVSPGLVAWELNTGERVIKARMEAAEADGLIAPAGWDEARGEELWRLTPSGRDELAGRMRSGREQS
jgi:hypothetical protein